MFQGQYKNGEQSESGRLGELRQGIAQVQKQGLIGWPPRARVMRSVIHDPRQIMLTVNSSWARKCHHLTGFQPVAVVGDRKSLSETEQRSNQKGTLGSGGALNGSLARNRLSNKRCRNTLRFPQSENGLFPNILRRKRNIPVAKSNKIRILSNPKKNLYEI